MMVDTRDLISQAALARRLSINSSAIANWKTRFKDFPKPVYSDSERVVLFSRKAIRQWLRSHARSWTV
jgi:predicted DNA-binding transcriptional regulator AlpA